MMVEYRSDMGDKDEEQANMFEEGKLLEEVG